MRASRLLKKISGISIARIWYYLKNPQMIVPNLSEPEGLSSVQLSCTLTNLEPDLVERYRMNFLEDKRFFSELDAKFINVRHRRAGVTTWQETMYLIVRLLQPQLILETGVFDGQSSAVILKALGDNSSGELVSIDLPAHEPVQGSTNRMRETTLPKALEPGWAIPEYLRTRHRLYLGDSKDLLPQILKEYKRLDIFIHDSLHTFEHQYYEYTTAWPYIPEGGLLCSDDIEWSPAFHKFCKLVHRDYYRVASLGIIKK